MLRTVQTEIARQINKTAPVMQATAARRRASGAVVRVAVVVVTAPITGEAIAGGSGAAIVGGRGAAPACLGCIREAARGAGSALAAGSAAIAWMRAAASVSAPSRSWASLRRIDSRSAAICSMSSRICRTHSAPSDLDRPRSC